jgi:glycoprotein endo-alpha-1,2-mannosidase
MPCIKIRSILTALAVTVSCLIRPFACARAESVSREVLAFYYGWYGNAVTSGRWFHWEGIDAANQHIENSTDFPVYGAYDSHNPAIVERQAEAAHAVGITGFIASWWGQGSFEDRGMQLLLSTSARHGLVVSAYYETIEGADATTRKKSAIADLDYLLTHYATDEAWLRAEGKPVIFVYTRALDALSPADWREVMTQVRIENPGGVLLVADSVDRAFVSVFDGASTYNITGLTQRKSPQQIQAWAHDAYPQMVAAAGEGRISTVTVIPGCDDRAAGRPPPRPVTSRWGGETYKALWREAIAAAPDYVLITSWNEWHEGTELEPSVEYGSRILNDTAVFARQFLSKGK